jgi:hypothetical protein
MAFTYVVAGRLGYAVGRLMLHCSKQGVLSFFMMRVTLAVKLVICIKIARS